MIRPRPLSARAAVLAAGLMLFLSSAPAAAHRLKLFVTVEGMRLSGYAFFIGGGRPQGAHVAFRDDAGATLGAAITDADGAFAFTPPAPQDIAVVVDAGDGHAATAHLSADLFSGDRAPAATASFASPERPAPPPVPLLTPSGVAAAGAPICDPKALTAAVDAAVARQIRPLLEAEVEAEGRVRFNDVMGGVGMIFGLAGAALWATARRGARAGA